MLRIAYRIFPLDPAHSATGQQFFWLPVVPIRLVNGERTVRVEGIVDSGSHFCLFHWRVGELLGLKVSDGSRDTVLGALQSSKSEVFYHRVRMVVADEVLTIVAGFSRDALQPCLLARDGFFDSFLVTFNPAISPPGLEIDRVIRPKQEGSA